MQEKIDADIYLMEPIDPALCAQHPGLWDFGIYRTVECTDSARERGLCPGDEETYEEFLPYCNPEIEKYLSMHKDDKAKWIELLTKECKK